MNVPWLDSGIRQIAVTSIGGYQKYISPHKGFSCAYRLLYRGESCSQYVKRMVAQKGLLAAIAASRQRFLACREANQILRTRIHKSELEQEDTSKKTKRNNIHNQDNCVMADSGCCECGAGSLDCASLLPSELPSCDLLDCGHCASGIDCSGLDCAGADCGSCG